MATVEAALSDRINLTVARKPQIFFFKETAYYIKEMKGLMHYGHEPIDLSMALSLLNCTTTKIKCEINVDHERSAVFSHFPFFSFILHGAVILRLSLWTICGPMSMDWSET